MTQTALHVNDLSVTYRSRRGSVDALKNIAVSIPAGQAVALLGPNGSGKSTLFKAVCGFVRIECGDVEVFGQPASQSRHLFGVVFQTDSLDPHMTVEENLRDHAALYGIPSAEARERIEASLTRAGLVDRKSSIVRTLSRGLTRRVDLCRALLHRPRLLLLDEPTVGLDPHARSAFLSLLAEHRGTDGLTIVMSTHLIDEADRQDRVVLLHHGQIIADDSPEVLRLGIGARLITIFDQAWSPPQSSADLWTRVSGGWAIALRGSDDGATLASELAASGTSYSIAPPTLADVFEHYTGDPLEGAAW